MGGKAAAENRGGNYCSALELRPRKRTCRVSRDGSGAFRAVRDFFFNVILERSHYELRSSFWTIPWRVRKMRGKFELRNIIHGSDETRSLG